MSIEYDVHDAVVVITIDRPEVMNCLDPEHNDALAAAFARYQADDGLLCAILTGSGEQAFSAGADLRRLIPPFRDAVRSGEEPPWVIGGITGPPAGGKPAIAAVNGYALAGGLELALACDFRIASPNATFGLAETRWAIIPGAGGTQRLPRAIPLGPAMEMILTGDPVGVDEALRWGLINRVVPSEDLLPTALALAATIASRGPVAVRAARRAVHAGLTHGLESGLGIERDIFFQVLRTDDAVEGSTAFSEKRRPVYVGR